MKNFEQWFGFTLKASKVILFVVLIAAVCTWSIDLIMNIREVGPKFGATDLPSLLFGAASLALFIFSILIAFFSAIFGWQTVQGIVRESVEKSMNTKVKLLENELRGRVASVMGCVVGDLSIDPVTLQPTDRGRLAEAISHCEQGYQFLKKVGGPAEFMGLNNLVFYECLYGGPERSQFLLKKGRVLKETSEENKSVAVLLTACRAILQYSPDTKERNEARELLAALASAATTSAKEKREAQAHIACVPAPEVFGGSEPVA